MTSEEFKARLFCFIVFLVLSVPILIMWGDIKMLHEKVAWTEDQLLKAYERDKYAPFVIDVMKQWIEQQATGGSHG